MINMPELGGPVACQQRDAISLIEATGGERAETGSGVDDGDAAKSLGIELVGTPTSFVFLFFFAFHFWRRYRDS